jgi:antirestriction protein ArdC
LGFADFLRKAEWSWRVVKEDPLTLSDRIRYVIVAAVFNAAEMEGNPDLEPSREVRWNPIEKAEQLLSASGARIQYSQGTERFIGSRKTDHRDSKSRNVLNNFR